MIGEIYLIPTNEPISRQDKCALLKTSSDYNHCYPEENESETNQVKFDDFKDLCNEEVLFLLALSGGGTRAISLATHTLALLEKKYNQEKEENQKPLIDRIHVISSVSGGSIFAYQIARVKTALDKINKINNQASGSDRKKGNAHNFFQVIESLPFKTYNQGFYTSLWYTSPANLFAGPLLTTLTNTNYLDMLAGGMSAVNTLNEGSVWKSFFCTDDSLECNTEIKDNFSAWEFVKNIYNPQNIKLSEISELPRIFFNATTLETGLPFVFTQRYVNLPNSKESLKTVRYEFSKIDEKNKQALKTATTLEEINSTPMTMPLAYAAMASAAFPFALEPLALRKYGYHPVKHRIYETSERIHVTDGGIYDNSGLSTLSDFVDFYRELRKDKKDCKTKRIVLLSISAEIDEYDLYSPHKIASAKEFLHKIPITVNFPLRTKSFGIDATVLTHYANKLRAEQIAMESIDSKGKLESENMDFYFFPVSIRQLSQYEKYRINDPDNLFEKVRKIRTDFLLSDEEDLWLAHTADLLIRSNQSSEVPWIFCKDKTPPLKLIRLDEAFIRALKSSECK